MLTRVPSPTIQGQSGAKPSSLGYDFALLGLRASEARVDIIRQAARQTAARIQQVACDDEDESDQLLSDLASSTYRLLDPRKRTKLRERIQLSIVDDADFDLQKGSRRPLLSASFAKVSA